MTVVVDVGCHFYPDHPRDESVEKLIARFKPDCLYGFDPLAPPINDRRNGCIVSIQSQAAWLHDGDVLMGLGAGGLSATLIPEKDGHNEWGKAQRMPCFDFARWLKVAQYGWGSQVVVKLDCEGAEVPLLEDVLRRGADVFISLLLVEWHGEQISAEWRAREDRIAEQLRCPIEAWA